MWAWTFLMIGDFRFPRYFAIGRLFFSWDAFRGHAWEIKELKSKLGMLLKITSKIKSQRTCEKSWDIQFKTFGWWQGGELHIWKLGQINSQCLELSIISGIWQLVNCDQEHEKKMRSINNSWEISIPFITWPMIEEINNQTSVVNEFRYQYPANRDRICFNTNHNKCCHGRRS